jgi:1-acyl-sn-glycerol-3-phosphate acyltransferase
MFSSTGNKLPIQSHETYSRRWTVWRRILRRILPLLFCYAYENAPSLKDNYIVICNHVCNLDPWLCGLSFKDSMYYLAGEQILRLGWISRFIVKNFGIISKIKGKSDATAVISMIKHIKAGHNVCFFPEGNRTFNGLTGKIDAAAAKLIKISSVPLITFRFEGGYFTSPRWSSAFSLRRGWMHGHVIRIYQKDEIAGMTQEKLLECIQADLAEDAYARQALKHIKYKARKRAIGLESALFLCPCCGRYDSLETKGSCVYCTHCGAESVYTVYGTLAGSFKFQTITDWDMWQTKKLYADIDAAGKGTVLLNAPYVELSVITSGHKEKKLASGELLFYKDRLTVADYQVKLETIIGMQISLRKVLLFSCKDGLNYQIMSKSLKNGRKFALAYNHLFPQNGG